MKLVSSINVPRNFGILAALLLSFKQPALAVETTADSDGKRPNVEQNDEQKSYEQAVEEAAKREKAEIEKLSKRVAELNRNADREGKRRAELQEAVDKGAPGAAEAIRELQILRNRPAIREREDYIRELEAKHAELSKKLTATEAKLKKVQSSRGSRFSNERDLDAEELKLAGWRESLTTAIRINNRILDRLKSGATTFSEGPMTQETLQERFFPTR
jgi:chromosome segregation ATPase